MLWKPGLPRWRPLRVLILVTFILVLTYFLFGRHRSEPSAVIQNEGPAPAKATTAASKPLPCLSLKGIEDVVVLIKTSAAELEQKLPDLLASTLKCFPTYLIYSDYTENHKGQPIIDALEGVSPKIKSSHPDFDLYRRLQKGGPDELADEEMWSADQTSHKLDKWKMLPIIDSAYEKYGSEKKWFVFVDMKSHFFQSNLMTWLNSLDAEEPYFMNIQGSQDEATMLLDSGSFILSRPAIESISAEYNSKQKAYEQLTSERATGHSILRHIVGKARSRTKSLQLTKSWPMFHPFKPATIDYGETSFFNRLWCYPAIFHEGLTPAEITELWKFEQKWITDHPEEGTILKHSDIFTDFILPRLTIRSGRVDDWDNLSGKFEEGKEMGFAADCLPLCVANEKCVQYAFKDGKCVMSETPKMGVSKNGVQSRWLLARAQRFGEQMASCKGDESWD